MSRHLLLCAAVAAALAAPLIAQQAAPEKGAKAPQPAVPPKQPLYPLSAVVDGDGAIFVADRKLPGVWKIVDNTPAIYFQASNKLGTPLNAVRCLALDHEGKLLAGDSATTTVYRFDDEGKPQPVHTGRVGIPTAIAVNKAGDIFVADLEPGRHAIRKIPAGGGEAVEFAKVGAPRGMTIDDQGRLYVVQHVGDLLIRLDAEGKSEVLVAGQPLKSPAFPAGIVLGKDNTAYLADGYNRAVWKVPPGEAPAIFVEGEPLVHPVWLLWRGEQLLVVDPRAKSPLIHVTLDWKAKPVELKIPAGP
ncbi:MAG TPA: NHL repeat-containing protein [Pirellulaceae bacterium]|nr:NHL repeat-containing protein [Pirellulaceae bacterium]